MMKTIKIYNFIAILAIMLLLSELYTQIPSPFGSKCGFDPGPVTAMPIGTYCKPESITKYTNLTNATFPTLLVFVQFRNDPGNDGNNTWAQGQAPSYLNTTIARYRNLSYTNWWDAYIQNTEYLSDFWMEASRGALHVTGQAFHIQLDNTLSYYEGFQNGMEVINTEIYTKLQPLVTNWPEYDQWGYNRSTEQVTYGADGYIDMIYKVHRYLPPQWYANASLGHSTQGENHEVYNLGGVQKFVNGNFGLWASGTAVGTGFQIDGKPVLNQWSMVSFAGHEHGHYLFIPGHQYYSKVNNDFGMEEFFSPYDLLHMGWYQSKKVNYSTTSSYSIDDFSSRNNQPYNNEDEILEVPVNGDLEFFLIVNRQKVSNWDKIMWGDTARGNPYWNINQEYGKGLYIYHAWPQQPNYPWPIATFDQECADGLWNWSYIQDIHPDWDPAQWVPYYKRTTPVYSTNDPTNYNVFGQSNGLQNRDGKSINHHWNENGTWKPYLNWFGNGKEKESNQYTGTDKIFTNVEEIWTSREHQGDRWDSWRVGYNEVFSPYSSPSTVNWNNQQTGIFIHLESQNGNTANLKIYKAGEGLTEEQILSATPPSKPMLYRPVEVFNCNGTFGHPRITWDNNLEPDMLRTSGLSSFKRYKIYRANSTNSNTAPLTYSYIGTYDDYTPNDTANYIDNNVINGVMIYCNLQGQGNNDTYFRYKISAVDLYYESVKSDFVSIKGHSFIPDVIPSENEAPLRFGLEQNYPNPFNPSTEIKFSIPQNSFVSLKIYDAVGQLVALLVDNEYRNAGRYSSVFDASNLASGIYFYSIEAGTFKDVKKMVLLK